MGGWTVRADRQSKGRQQRTHEERNPILKKKKVKQKTDALCELKKCRFFPTCMLDGMKLTVLFSVVELVYLGCEDKISVSVCLN